MGYKAHNKVFTAAMEAELAEYLKTSATFSTGSHPKKFDVGRTGIRLQIN